MARIVTRGVEPSPKPVRGRSTVLAGVLAGWSLALVAGWAAGCRSAAVASANLDALHRSDGSYKYRARQLTPMRAFLAKLLISNGLDPEDVLLRQKEKGIANPAKKTLEQLLHLAEGPPDGEGGRGLRAQRVRQFAYLACEDPSALVRERSLIELGPIAANVGLGAPEPMVELPANAPELSEGIRGLAQVVKPMAQGKGEVSETQRLDLEAACGLLGELEYDVDGAHRILAVTAAILERGDAEERFAPVAELSAGVERSMIRQALARSLKDPVPRTRAAAVEANWRAYGDAYLVEALRAASGTPPAEGAVFQMEPIWPGDEEMFLTIFRLVRDHGLPIDDDDRAGRLQQLFILSTIAVDYSLFTDRTRNAAMLALSEVSGSGIRSLRLEDWQDWWDDFGEREQAALRELDAERAAAQPES